MTCRICADLSNKIFSKKILRKYDVDYYQCENCYFLQTEFPFWLEEAYSTGAISALDVGIMSRNLLLLHKTQNILGKLFSNFNAFSAVDYGGGEGVFVRLMRDKGFNFYRQDLHADNLYARYFDVKDLPVSHKFDILTAFEVFEHLPNPIEEITKMFNYSDTILLSTELQPTRHISELKDWWYFVPETGQHVSFYTEDAFDRIAKKFNVYYYTDSINLHILSREKFSANPFVEEKKAQIKKTILQRIVNKINYKINQNQTFNTRKVVPESLIMKDFEYVKKKLQNDDLV
ncbi:class I SAM-dependent methyltransferase [Gillisia limnaea]|uniref:Methyltransferase type 11 n=1 Tax=Gillisia limnaea (strain DSM 15749 / LMG 21470 / R-8282) TaxID=865937 RepID=H2BV91_GILLR|nr:class I SAM-dependent methyltransferase [Gillisia limnaea]EHQ01756.1 methyltransferase type 11 [Gillisia limnaea DSM 15749]